jgi:pimeloyl-ACP methyl ester carboxylesterase
VRIQQTIRRRFVEALAAPGVSRPHVVVSHSMGTVIAYDCLKRVADCPTVDGLITLGSPLGLDEVQDQLQPGWSRTDGYPHERVHGAWTNVFDRLDPVCGFDPMFANDYLRGGLAAAEDIAVSNDGTWRHSLVKYLRQPPVTAALRRMLAL